MSNKYEYSDYYTYDFGTKLLPSSAILLEGGCKLRNLFLFQLTSWLKRKCFQSAFSLRSGVYD